VALALENAMFVKELQDKKRMEDDLVAARRIQVSLLPKELPRDPRCDLAARYVPCLEVGGDCYDALRLPDGRMGFSLGDICGKGITAALMMANLQALFRLEARRGGDPHVVLSTINRLFHESTQTEHFATFLYGAVDLDTGSVRYCCAGHEPMLVVRAGGDVVEMPRGGLPVGILPDFPYLTQTLQLDPGDVCVLFSDGITEQTDDDGEEFGRDRLRAVVTEARALPAEAVLQSVEAAVRGFAAHQQPADDFTLLVMKLTGLGGGLAPS
jgi:sigma-B regulation protein RsbU (phosphoserine phosphatase)